MTPDNECGRERLAVRRATPAQRVRFIRDLIVILQRLDAETRWQAQASGDIHALLADGNGNPLPGVDRQMLDLVGNISVILDHLTGLERVGKLHSPTEGQWKDLEASIEIYDSDLGEQIRRNARQAPALEAQP